MRWRSPTDSRHTSRLRIERQAVVARHLRQPRRHGRKALAAVEAERDVLGDGQVLEQREMLEHHADAERARLRRAGELDRLALPAHLAGARLDQAVDDLHQRRLAGAVLAEQRVDLAGIEVEIDAVIGEEDRRSAW